MTNPIDKRKAELREYIEARKPTVKIKLPGTSNEIDLRHAETIKSALIAEQLLECIEALEQIKEKLNGVQTIHMTIPTISKLTDAEIKLVQFSQQDAIEALNKIAGAEGDTTNGRIEK